MDDYCRKREEESIQTGGMRSKRTVTLQQSFVDILDVGQVGSFALDQLLCPEKETACVPFGLFGGTLRA